MTAGAALGERPAVASAWLAAGAACPKHMAHGPCAGVGADGACEVPDVGECSFLGVAADEWPYGDPASNSETRHPFLTLAAQRAVVVADLPTCGPERGPMLAAAEALRGAADALLLGDHGGARLQFPPSYRAKLLVDEGHPVWVGINARDRNRVALEAELAACADAGVSGVHCVTGDHTALGDRPDAQPVFDLDCVGIVRHAVERGLLASVAHAPSAPPVEQRVPRLLAKAAAGAQVVFVDHCGGPDAVERAVAALRAAGFAGLAIACVPVVTDRESAAVVESFAGTRLPAGYLRQVLDARDPLRVGIAAAVELSTALLAIEGVGGVNLSGGTSPGHEAEHAGVLAEIANEVLG